jgi:hypothetical protein
MLQDLKLGQYTKVPPRWTFAFQMAGSIVGSIFNYTSERRECYPPFTVSEQNFKPLVMRSIVDNNREVLLDPIGTRVVGLSTTLAELIDNGKTH